MQRDCDLCLAHPARRTWHGLRICQECATVKSEQEISWHEGGRYVVAPGNDGSTEIYCYRDHRRIFVCCGDEWPTNAAARRMGAVARWSALGRVEGGEGE